MKAFLRFLLVITFCLLLFVCGITFNETFRNQVRNLFDQAIDLKNAIALNSNETISTQEDTSPTDSSYVNDSSLCLYYEMLSDNEKQVYGQIVKNIESLNDTFQTIVPLSAQEVSDTMTAVYNDHPEYFWLETTYTYGYIETDQIVRQITLSFNETANDFEASKQAFEDAANAIIVPALQLPSDYEKEKYVHDTLMELLTYDTNAALSQSAYSALVNHVTVCAGYSKSFQYIMNQLGVPTYNVIGYAEEDHSWNIILLDGEYYNVDLTWDDQETTIYNFFNVPDYEFNTTHSRTGLSMNLPACNGEYYKSTNLGLFVVPLTKN